MYKMSLFVFLLSSLVLSSASPDPNDNDEIVVVKVSSDGNEEQRHQLERQERRLDAGGDTNNDVLPITIELFETDLGENVVEEMDIEVTEMEEDEEEPKNRGLVPQLWANYTGPPEAPAHEVGCDVAQMKCGYRAGCGLALQNYVLGCSDLAAGRTRTCSAHCRHSLIAIMSTHEGKRLMKVRLVNQLTCKCSLLRRAGTGFTNISTIFLSFFYLFSKSLLNFF
jgi:hypothetical protein